MINLPFSTAEMYAVKKRNLESSQFHIYKRRFPASLTSSFASKDIFNSSSFKYLLLVPDLAEVQALLLHHAFLSHCDSRPLGFPCSSNCLRVFRQLSRLEHATRHHNPTSKLPNVRWYTSLYPARDQ
jgi:hypothetical protein